MLCEHLTELFNLCEKHELKIASQDAIKIVCRQCQQQEVCPSSLTDGELVVKLPRPPATTSEQEPDAEPAE